MLTFSVSYWIMGLFKLNNRSKNIKRVTATRSAAVKAMLSLLRDLDTGNGGDLEGFEYYGIKDSYKMEGRINSYRAQKIANRLGKNISKKHLVDFSKDRDLLAKNDLAYSGKDSLNINEFLDINSDALIQYYLVIKSFYISNALSELDNKQ
jgi:hypothetical protein